MLLIRNANIVGRGMSDILIGDDGKSAPKGSRTAK